MPSPARSVDVQYRKNLAEFNAWEDSEREKQEQAIARFKAREHERNGHFTVPRWVAILAAIVGLGAIGYLFVVLAFSF